jgi:hypothetical protein
MIMSINHGANNKFKTEEEIQIVFILNKVLITNGYIPNRTSCNIRD